MNITNANQTPGLFVTVRKRYFSTKFNTAVTLIFAIFSAWVMWGVLNWALLDAVFGADNRDMCLDHAKHTGACWSVVAARWRLILFGLFPFDEQWRSAIACGAIIVVAILSCVPYFWSAQTVVDPVAWRIYNILCADARRYIRHDTGIGAKLGWFVADHIYLFNGSNHGDADGRNICAITRGRNCRGFRTPWDWS